MSPQSSQSPVAYTLQIISVNDLPPRRFKILGKQRSVLVKATVEDCSVQTKSRLCASSPEWEETFEIEARETSSVLSLQLFDSAFRSTSLICASEIPISDLLQLCRYGKDAKLNLCDIKSRLKGSIKIHLSLTRNGSWIVDEAQRWALVLSRQPNTAMAATGGYIDDIDGMLAISVPTPPAMAAQSIVNVLDKLSHFMRIADEAAKVHPYAKLAWDVLSAAHKIIVAQVAIDQSVADLANTMQGTYSFVDATEAVPSKIPLLEDIIQQIFIQTVECAIFIREYSGHGFAGRLLRETMGASTPAKVAGMAQNLITLRSQFDTGVAVQIATISFRIQTDVTTLLENQTLDKLGSSGVDLSSISHCLPGTRCDVIDEIHEWALHPSKGDDSNVLWLHGVAGTGKSAVAATVATHFSEMGRLGAFVGFDRETPAESQPYPVVKALALQMAAFDGRLRDSIVGIINDRTKASVLQAPLSRQFDRLIIKPLASIPTLRGDGPIVIVLDALYECGQSNGWAEFLEVLFGQTELSLPSNLRFIITSRTANGILEAFTSTALQPRMKSRELHANSYSEISAYFAFRMQQIRRKNKDLQEDWPGPGAIAELTTRASGFFAWAVHTSNFIDAYSPPERLKSLLLQPLIPTAIEEPYKPLDELYRAALDSAGDWTDAHFVSDFRAIMCVIIDSPIAISTIDITRLVDPPLLRPLMMTIRRLGSLLTHGPLVQVLHPSFFYFLSSRERCGRDVWYIEHEPVRPWVNAGPATLCLRRMNAGLKRNICNMTLSVRLATEMLPEELAYACQSWVDHICTEKTFESPEMEKLTVVFLRTHLLHWFEAMSLLKKSEEIAPMLQRFATWLEENIFEDKSLRALVIDAINFAHKFAVDIAEHPLHVYYTALPFCPSRSQLYQLFHNALVDPSVLLVPPYGPVQISAEPATMCLRIMNAGLKRNMCNMPLSARLTTETLPEVLAYACQSWADHLCIEKTFESLETEKLTVVFLRAHLLHWFEAMSVLKKSEEIAPMLQRVGTWLEDNTFEDKSLGKLVTEAIDFARKFAAVIAEHPLHVYYTALPFYPSDSKLYQLFHDALVDPSVLSMEIEDRGIFCMALSTDGRRLVTGFFSRVTVWDTATGHELLQTAATHKQFCRSISAVFSNDGSCIACGTDQSSVHVWDSASGALVIGPLTHSGLHKEVNVLAWSMDGECLLSGCRDGGVALWNIKVKRYVITIHHPGCSAEETSLRSVALSPDGSQIASCSGQGDVHVWDSKTGSLVWSVKEPQGSERWVSVSFLSGDMGSFLLAKTEERTQARYTTTGDLCPLPDSLAGAVGLTRGDLMVNLLVKGIAKRHGITDKDLAEDEWAAQGKYFVFSHGKHKYVVHLPNYQL